MNDIKKTNQNNISKNQPQTASTQITLTHSGPIPSSAELMAYETIQSGFANRIVTMAEEQSSHRKMLESKQIDAEIKHLENRDKEAKLGQIFGFIIAIVGIGSGLFAALKGAQFYGSLIGASTIASIVYIFVKGRDQK